MFNNGKKVKNINEDILNWYLKKENVLNVVSPPYNTLTIFNDVIEKCLSENKRVLIITNNKYSCELEQIKEKYKNNRNFDSMNAKFVKQVNGFYDLIIYDDITSFSKLCKYEIQLLLSYIAYDAKVISYGVEPIFYNCNTFWNFPKDLKVPIVEPRIINTRIDINNEIPYSIYEYLYWSIQSNINVIVYCPNEDKGKRIYDNLNVIKNNLGTNIKYYDTKDKGILKDVNIIVTHNLIYFDNSVEKFNIVVYFANNEIFNYKKLLYLAGKAGNGEEDFSSEVIFLSKELSEEMEKAKDITRKFNKRAWDLLEGK